MATEVGVFTRDDSSAGLCKGVVKTDVAMETVMGVVFSGVADRGGVLLGVRSASADVPGLIADSRLVGCDRCGGEPGGEGEEEVWEEVEEHFGWSTTPARVTSGSDGRELTLPLYPMPNSLPWRESIETVSSLSLPKGPLRLIMGELPVDSTCRGSSPCLWK